MKFLVPEDVPHKSSLNKEVHTLPFKEYRTGGNWQLSLEIQDVISPDLHFTGFILRSNYRFVSRLDYKNGHYNIVDNSKIRNHQKIGRLKIKTNHIYM